MSVSQDDTSANLSDNMYKKAQKLAWLLVQSVMPQEQKEGWMNLLPLMTEQQVDVLIEVLEQEHASYKMASQDLMKDLKQLEESLAGTMQKLKAEERQLIDQFIHTKLAEYNQST